jgi:CBS domain-containing protein
MAAQGVSALLIVDGDRLTGIITDRDLRSRVLAAGLEPTRPISEVMTPDPISASPDVLAFEAMLAMVGRTIHHLPLVADGRPVGIVTSTDLLRLEHANPRLSRRRRRQAGGRRRRGCGVPSPSRCRGAAGRPGRVGQ